MTVPFPPAWIRYVVRSVEGQEAKWYMTWLAGAGRPRGGQGLSCHGNFTRHWSMITPNPKSVYPFPSPSHSVPLSFIATFQGTLNLSPSPTPAPLDIFQSRENQDCKIGFTRAHFNRASVPSHLLNRNPTLFSLGIYISAHRIRYATYR